MSLSSKDIIDILKKARENGMSIFLEDGKLRYTLDKNKTLSSEFLTSIKNHKEDIIKFLSSEAGDVKSVKSNIEKILPYDRSKITKLPLTFSQERLWFIDRLEGSLQYHIPAVLRLKGKLNIDAVDFALQNIINRHEVLRSVILEEDGKGYQQVKDKDNWKLQVIDGSDYKDDEDKLKDQINKLIGIPFDLSKDHMIRGNLIRLGEDDNVLALVMHHIASDGWSVSVIVREFVELYDSFEKGRESVLLPLELQYADYAIWQRNHLKGKLLEKNLEYWKKKLNGVEPLQLPTDFVRPAVQSIKGDSLEFLVDKELTEKINELSKQNDTTLFMTLLAVINVLFYRYSGQEDICIGSPIAGRQQEEIEELIGFFINTLAMRSDVTGDTAFTELLQQVKVTTLEAYDHQEAPFEQVVETVANQRDMSRSPLFQAMFVLQNAPDNAALSIQELTLSSVDFDNKISKFDILISISESASGLHCAFEYCTDLFEERTVRRMTDHFKSLLNSITADPEQKIGLLPMLSESEENQLLKEFNDTYADHPKDKSITDLFEDQAARTPQEIAIVFEDSQITYRELNERSNRIAHYLRKKGIKEETLVPVCMDRSIDMIAGVIGILKAGAAYVPIDPDYPEERISYILKDTGANVLLSSKEVRSKIPETENLEIIETDTINSELDLLPSHNLPERVKPEYLTYVLYTSGSTGKPKGVRMTGSSLVNLLYWQENQFKNKKRSVLQFTSLNFDVSFQEIFSTLCFGSKLCLISAERRIDMTEVMKDISGFEVTNLFIPYIVLKNLAEHILSGSGDAHSLQEIITAGEQLKLTNDISELLKKNNIRLINQYGPTEAHVVSSYEINNGTENSSLPPIGKPIDNTQLYILSENEKPVPVGVPGELHIAGVQVALGYLNLPEQTTEKFIKDPFSNSEGSRMYKSGDLARWLPDGNIEYLGRTDDQIKIRGNRVELGEIESVLQQSELVSEAAVLAKEDTAGNKRLVGYVVPKEVFYKDAIVSFLKNKLPEFMIPDLWVEMESLPLNNNGKLDRKALPDPDADELLNKEYVAPRNETEEKLAAIWQELLGLEQVGVNDNFFEIGGHSLLAMRVISSIRRELEAELAIKDLFLHPTVSELAVLLQTQSKGSLLPAIEVADPRPEHIPLSFSQERLWFIDRLEGSVPYHLPAVLRLKGNLNIEALTFALRSIVNRHEVLRTVIKDDEETGEGYQVIKEKDLWELEIVDGSKYKDDQEGLQRYIQELIMAPFDLSADHMLRGHLIRVSDQDNVLAVTMHHISSDGWSMSIIVRELVEFYKAYEENREADLTPLQIQYADFAMWQRKYLQGEVIENNLDYWKKKLDSTEPLQLPTDYNRPPIQSTKGATKGFVIDKELSDSLQRLSQKQGSTLFMTLLSVFNVLLYRYSGQEDICVGSPIAGRQQKRAEELIGFFINTLALRNEVKGEDSFTGLLKQVRDTTLDAYEHQDIPFEKIVDSVVKNRDMSRSPLFQVMFMMQNTPDIPEMRLGDVQFLAEKSGYTASKFDITFSVAETPYGLNGSVEYCTDLFKEDSIERMIVHFRELINSIVSDPEQKVSRLSMLNKEEENQLLNEFNNTFAEYPADKTIVDIFEEQVKNSPDSTAIIFKDKQLTFKELNEQANRLANYLNSKGIKKEALVPICIEPGPEMITGILGILKSGRAYVPVDPDYPQERINYYLSDTGAKFILSSEISKAALDFIKEAEIIYIDSNEDIRNESNNNLSVEIKPEDPAYVIYTSGSTGKPKGVVIEHRNIFSYLLNNKTKYITDDKDSTGSFIHLSFTFDASLTSIFMPLLNGKSAVVSSNKSFEVFDDENLQKHAPYDFIKLTPSHLELLQPKFKLNIGLSLTKKLVVGGEALNKSQVGYLAEEKLDVEIVNEYGPTEATVGCSIYRFNTSDDLKDLKDNISIGKPIDNVQLYILGDQNELLPVGIAGELCIGGAGLAREYLNQPDLTKEKFIPDPFSKAPGARIYRTGDLARWQSDGNIEFLGRKDDQVKIRGNRIEPGEIESVIRESELVQNAVVLAKDDNTGSKRLIAYVVPDEKYNKDLLQQFLKTRLPEYMIPGIWMEMENLPLTSNGKIDKKALPDPEVSELLSNEYAAPRTETEEKLASIWQELLSVDRVGINDNFFDLGGHSLLAMRLIPYVRRELESEITIRDIFLNPTIAQLSLIIDSRDKGSILPEITAEPRPENIPLSFGQERMWFIDRLEGSVHYHVPSVLRLKGKLNSEALNFALHSIVKRHEVIRTIIREKDGVGYQYIKDAEGWNLEIVDGSKYMDDQNSLQKYIKELISKPFDLTKDFMMRGHLIKIDNDDHVLVVTVHHLASDGMSTSIMVRDLVEYYKSFEEGREANLSPLPLQFADFAIWQRKYLQGETLDKKLDYWKKKLESVEPIQIPTDFPRPASQSINGAVSGFNIDKELTDALQSLSIKHGVTLYMTLLSAYKVLLHKYSEQNDITVGSPIVGRQQKELEELIGSFFNTLALRSEVKSDTAFTDLMQQVKNTTLEAYEHQDVPFEKVVETVVRQRDMGRSPVFQVAFTLQNTPDVPEVKLGDVQLQQGLSVQTTSKFDLSFGFTENPHGLNGIVEYCTDLYTEETVKRMSANFTELLRSIVKDPYQKIGSLQMLTESERHKLLEEFNATAVKFPEGMSLLDHFEERVRKTPDAVAVIHGDSKLTFKELNEQSNRLAHYLISKGVKNEKLIPIFVERSLHSMTGLLGVLKAGGAFVPVDTDYPDDRIKFMLEDTEADIILSTKESRSGIKNGNKFDIIELDGGWINSDKWSSENPKTGVKENNLAYIIYTSGSTGKPKGVMIQHSSLVNLTLGLKDKIAI